MKRDFGRTVISVVVLAAVCFEMYVYDGVVGLLKVGLVWASIFGFLKWLERKDTL